MLEEQGREETRELIPGYEFIKKLGEGGMGEVFLARQKSMDRMVAIKILPKKLSKDKQFIERFLREARTAGRMNHVNIVRGLEVSSHNDRHYFVMDYIEGKSLKEIIPGGKGLKEEKALHYTMQVARGLGYANEMGIIHRDIKPDNILIDNKDIAHVCDMGLAKQVDSETEVTMTGMMVGTPHYVSPEQARGDKTIDTRSDIYSLGATLYYMLTGQTPFQGSSAAVVLTKHLSEEIPNPQELNPKISDNCCLMIERMMAKDPADRYQTPEELIADMELVIDGKEPESDIIPAGRSSIRPRAGAGRKSSPKKESARLKKYHEPRPEKKPVPAWVIGGGIAAVALIGVLVLSMMSEEKPQKPPQPVKQTQADTEEKDTGQPQEKDSAEEMFVYAKDWYEKNPEAYNKAIQKYEMIKKSFPRSVWVMKARDAIDKIKAARQTAANTAFSELQNKADAFAEKGDYDSAIAVYKDLPEKFAEILKPEAGEKAAELRKEAAARITTALKTAEQLLADGEPGQGMAELDKLTGLKYQAMKKRITDTRARLQAAKKNAAQMAERKAKAAAKKKLETAHNEFDKKLWVCDYTGAQDILKKAEVDPDIQKLEEKDRLASLKSMLAGISSLNEKEKKAVQALNRLKGSKNVKIRTVKGTYKGNITDVKDGIIFMAVKFSAGGSVGYSKQRIKISDLTPEERTRLLPEVKPENASEHLAAAVTAMARFQSRKKDRDFSLLEKAEVNLTNAKENPLTRHYTEKLDELKMGEKEAFAKREFEKQILDKEQKKYTKTTGKAMLAAIDTYLEKHGTTEFAKSKEEEISRIKTEARKPLGHTIYTKFPFDANEARRRQLETAKVLGIPVEKVIDLGDGVKIELMLIPAGEFLMGGKYDPEVIHKRGPGGKLEWWQREHPRHKVRITKPYYMGKFEVTQAVWQKVMGTNPSKFKNPQNPVEKVSWHDCRAFLIKLNTLADKSKTTEDKSNIVTFRLPTEAEWEHACRAGTDTPFWWGEKISTDIANYDGTRGSWDGVKGIRRGKTVNVGSFNANPWGLYDVHGNVREWCEDWYGSYTKETAENPGGPEKGSSRVLRGGSWYSHPGELCSANRGHTLPSSRHGSFGLRLVAVPVLKSEKSGIEKLQNISSNPKFLSYLRKAGCVLYLPFDRKTIFKQGDKLIARDLSGHNNHGVIHGATLVKGAVGEALSFDGKDDYINIGNPVELQVTGDQTITFWLKQSDFSARRNPYSKAYGGEGTVTVETDGRVSYYYGTDGGNSRPYQDFTMTSNIVVSNWVHLAIVRDLSNMKLRWYKNGMKTDEENAKYTSAASGSNSVYIGAGYKNNIEGFLDDVCIFNRALSEREIKALYKLGRK